MVSVLQVCAVLAQTCNLPARAFHQHLMARPLQALQVHSTVLVT
jgi:hypothetical protein